MIAVAQKPLVVRITTPEQLNRITAPLTVLFEKFLKKAQEPWSAIHQWQAVMRALVEGEQTLFLVAVDEKVKPVGHVLAQLGYSFWGVKSCSVIQIYAQAPGVVREFEKQVVEWARENNCQVITGASRRHTAAMARRFKMEPYSVSFVRILDKGDSDEGSAGS